MSQKQSENTAETYSGYLQLFVVNTLHETHHKLPFRIKPNTRLGRLKDMYCTRIGINKDTIRFVFDGHRIVDDETPSNLGLADGDIIEVYQQATGGM